MTDKIAQFQEWKRFAATLRSFLKVSEELAEVGSIEQAADEAGKRRDALLAEEREIRARIAADQEAHEQRRAEERAQCAQLLAQARAEADALIAGARTEAASIVSAAETRGAGLVEAAMRSAAEKEAAIAASTRTLGEIGNTINARRLELEAVNAQIAAAESKRDEIEAHIKALKAKF
jgi:chromosome segregation ATPase